MNVNRNLLSVILSQNLIEGCDSIERDAFRAIVRDRLKMCAHDALLFERTLGSCATTYSAICSIEKLNTVMNEDNHKFFHETIENLKRYYQTYVFSQADIRSICFDRESGQVSINVKQGSNESASIIVPTNSVIVNKIIETAPSFLHEYLSVSKLFETEPESPTLNM